MTISLDKLAERVTFDEYYARAQALVGTEHEGWYGLKQDLWNAGFGTADFEEDEIEDADNYIQIYEDGGEPFNATLRLDWTGNVCRVAAVNLLEG